MNKDEIGQLGRNHWTFVQGLMTALNLDEETMLGLRYVYIEAFIHGFKHGQGEISKDFNIKT